ncbi:hypothetical protein NN3_18320 [Nocardia neocaledoniensis NBRC 108232]|uniref:Uncharacterized protein n=1 Tax=Nocardia neocaledoniensis TaxID=236511 RepID=A0A317N573_9NOCA|nr:hypothetical protein [Nocardia neocaledoniensis]PWV70445.1 hypothetical protein DFR69_113159 [Nocardia neocaledoniensis]GEM30825.1 hypothetical protein NN3_18320 [Nocardia neocaledoniensis NBRC 108232]
MQTRNKVRAIIPIEPIEKAEQRRMPGGGKAFTEVEVRLYFETDNS